MIKQELAEIKKNTKETNNCISKIAGCYVDTEKNKKACYIKSFYALTEEEQYKYFELFQKGLSGKINKNHINMEFPKKAYEEQGIQPFLYRIVKDGLKNEELVQILFDKIIETYDYPDNYYILIGYGDYDVPLKGKDKFSQDESEEVYSFIDCLICPMKQSKAGLAYNSKQDMIENAMRNMMIEMPVHGFLFPAFNDRSSDINALLYFTKKPEEINDGLINNLLTCNTPQTVNEQKDNFINAVEEGSGSTTFDQAVSLCQNVNEINIMENEKKDMVMDKSTTARILSQFNSSQINQIEDVLTAKSEDKEIHLTNMPGGDGNLEIKSGKAKIKLPIELADYISVEKKDGVNCIIIKTNDDIVVNGITVSHNS